MAWSLRDGRAYELEPVVAGELDPAADLDVKALPVRSGQAQLACRDADLVVQMEDVTRLCEPEEPGWCRSTDAECVRHTRREVDEAAGVELVVLVAGDVLHDAVQQVERLGFAGVPVQRGGGAGRLSDDCDADASAVGRGL